jgi:hypothetical protein
MNERERGAGAAFFTTVQIGVWHLFSIVCGRRVIVAAACERRLGRIRGTSGRYSRLRAEIAQGTERNGEGIREREVNNQMDLFESSGRPNSASASVYALRR